MQMQGYDCDYYTDGAKGLEAFKSKSYDLCVYDIMLPAKDGFQLARETRQLNNAVPIIFLTANGKRSRCRI
jgi:DNA-binding response OmpR family regulator